MAGCVVNKGRVHFFYPIAFKYTKLCVKCTFRLWFKKFSFWTLPKPPYRKHIMLCYVIFFLKEPSCKSLCQKGTGWHIGFRAIINQEQIFYIVLVHLISVWICFLLHEFISSFRRAVTCWSFSLGLRLMICILTA